MAQKLAALSRPMVGLTALAVAVVAATAAAVGSCVTRPGGAAVGEPLEARAEAEVVELVERQARSIADIAGVSLDNWRTVTEPCSQHDRKAAGEGRWKLSGHAGMPVEVDPDLTALRRLESEWGLRGYQVWPMASPVPAGQPIRLTAQNPHNGLTLTVDGTASRSAFELIIATPCYLPVEGEHPGR